MYMYKYNVLEFDFFKILIFMCMLFFLGMLFKVIVMKCFVRSFNSYKIFKE